MARKLFLTLVFVLSAFTFMYAYISEITNITNENHYKEFELYSHTIIKYENRLITQNNGSIHEYLIQEDGSLFRIAYFDKKQSVIAYIDGDRYYDVESLEGMSGLRINVYDLLYTPMQKINSFELLFISDWQRVYISQNHFLFYDQPNFRYILINKDNFNLERYLTLPYTLRSISDNLIIMQDGNNIRFYSVIDTIEYEMEFISEIEVSFDESEVVDCEIQNNCLVLSHLWGITIIDISDLLNPALLYHIITEEGMLTSFYTTEYLFSTDGNRDLSVYHLLGENEYSLVYQNHSGYYMRLRNMFFQYPYLYINQGNALNVYDINNNFSKIYSYGNYLYNYNIIPNQEDMYMLHGVTTLIDDDNFVVNYQIFNVLDDELFISFELFNSRAVDIIIKNNTLFFLKNSRNIGESISLNIYDIVDQQIEILCSLPLNPSTRYGGFRVINNKIYLYNYEYQFIEVYEFIDNDFQYLGFFSGRIQVPNSEITDTYFLNLYGNRVIVRDVNDFSEICSYILPYWGFEQVLFYYENHFLLYDNNPGNFRVYNHDVYNSSWSQIHTFPNSTLINTNNHIFTSNAYVNTFTSEYYTIINGELSFLGSKPDDRTVQYTYFYPERNKMVQYTASGIWVYDFEYEEYVADSDIPIPSIKTELLGNYPNPFNPTTTINLSLSVESNLRVDIYNIKGQKVKSLLNEPRHAGEHSIVWNGKDDNGSDVGSGIYFYRMEAEGYVETRKMVLMK